MDLHNLDPETLCIVVQMHQADLRQLAVSADRKGKGREGDVSDAVVAIRAYQSELASNAQFLSDRAMCRSMAQAVALDADEIRALEAEEGRCARDRELALRLSRDRKNAFQRTTKTQDLSDEMAGNMEALRINSPDDDIYSSGNAESSAWAASRRVKDLEENLNERKGATCVACGDMHYSFNVATCPGCHHEYCRECLQSLFESSMTDESLFPPKCCRLPIPLDVCRPFLSTPFIGQFLAKKIEFETPNRTYCSKPSCSTFVPPQAIKSDIARCIRCATTTCAVCKKAAHANSDCPDDPAAQELLQLAAQEGWQKCYSCARLVELDHGCNHITCRCGAQFCYVCGERWRTCTCPQWQEERLLARANAIVDRNVGARRLGANGRANLVERERQNLVQNHQCQHRSWGSRSGSHQCEECYDTLPNYIYECRQCHIMACRRCRYNRLV